jgi:Fe-S-cluster containining protein
VQTVRSVACPKCKAACEYVDWKIHIPSPKREREWNEFWRKYRKEKALEAEIYRDESIKEVTLELLNRSLRRGL